ncbi:MAG: tetratricopeptide repeat protein [Pirellulales bacterium]
MNARRGSPPAEPAPRPAGKQRQSRRRSTAASVDSPTPFGRQPWRNAALLFVGLWLALVVWRWEIVATPPYWDSAMGLFVEANFLAETGFDYRQLVNEERRFIEGGTGIYLVSVMPTLLAALMWLVSSTQAVLVIGHLANLAMAAALVLLVYATLAPRAGRIGAGLAAAALLTTPLFAAQVDMIGMDLPMTLVAFMAGELFIRERYLPAAALALVAYFIKLSGLLWLVAAFGCLALLLLAALVRGERAVFVRRVMGCGLLLIVASIEMFVMDWVNSLHTTIDQEKFVYNVEAGLASLAEVRYWCPDLLALAGIAFVGGCLAAAVRWRAAAPAQANPRQQATAASSEQSTPWPQQFAGMLSRTLDTLVADRQTLFGWLILLATVAALAQIYTIPRYLLLPLVFLWVNLGLVLFAKASWRLLGYVAVGLVIGFNLLNADGRYFPPIAGIDEFDQRTGALLERSREYLKDHRANLATVDYLVDNTGSRPIIAPNPFVHFLSLPRLGYVERPLSGYAANTFHTSTFLPVAQFRDDTAAGDPLFIWAANRFAPIVNCRLLRPDPATGDQLLHYSKLDLDAETIPSLAIFEHRAEGTNTRQQPSPAERHAALVAWLWPADDQIAQLDALIDHQQFATAVELCRSALATEPLRADLRLRYAGLLAKLGQTTAAIDELRRLIDDSPGNLAARRALAEILFADNQTTAGLAELDVVVRRDPSLFDVWLQIGQIQAAAGNFDAARIALTRAVELRPQHVRARLLLARTWRAEGDHIAARRSLADAVKQLPKEALLWHELAQCDAALGESRAALDAFRRAFELQPDSRELANSLAWHLATSSASDLRNPAEAVRLAEHACRDRETTSANWLDTLAAAYASAERFDDAVRTAEEAQVAARAAGDETLSAALEQRLQLYRANKPYTQ